MFTSWRLGRIFGFPVEINPSFLLLLALVFIAFGGFAGVLVVGLAFGSVLLHELGHALVARRLGVHVSGIELSFFGGAAKMMQMPRSADHEIAIAAAGPAVSLMLGGAGLGLGMLLDVPLLGSLFSTIGQINLVLAGFNLIPALPMDGGRILRALLSRKMDFVRATDVSVQVARVVAVGFGILGLLGAYQLLVLAPLLWIMGTRERILARTMAEHDAGYRSGGVDVLGRGAGPIGRPGGSYRSGGFSRGWYDDGLPVRRFTIRHVGGRLVIETLD
ncbi:MAG TPA: site-2 protease family protein [Kofleriaceae bacterium]|jgi:Zn-dependent protease|nr:site-2 protease family protein [Kofleriaceae bacterium]